VYAAAVPVEPAPASEHVESLLEWADELRQVEVLAEASSERLAQVGMSFGADGVLASGVDAARVRAIVDQGALWLSTSGLDARAAADALEPGRDVLLLDAADTAGHDAARARGVAVGRVVRPGEELPSEADAWLVSLPDAGAVEWLRQVRIPPEVRLAIRGDGALGAAALEVLAGRCAALVVAPLEVPIGRLCAARATTG
jgi:hypothetical protein